MDQEFLKATFLFKDELEFETKRHTRLAQTKSDNYEDFVDKFKTKKTTDDCFTPSEVYDVVVDYVRERCPQVKDLEIVRPFFPGGNYKAVDYTDKVVIDNPPFSILSEIKSFYITNNVPFFLFAPHLTLFVSDNPITHIVANAKITYENGANIPTSFVSNLFGSRRVIVDGSLKAKIDEVQGKVIAPALRYEYPDCVIHSAGLSSICVEDVYLEIDEEECMFTRALDSQRKVGKSIFGSGYIIGDGATERLKTERLKTERLKTERLKAELGHIIWELTDTEREMQKKLKRLWKQTKELRISRFM